MFGRRRLKFETPDFSVRIQVLFRENRQIVYREKGRLFDFGAEAVGPKWNQLNAIAPAEIDGEEQERIVANVANALDQMGYEYIIYERGEREVVSESEKALARNRLREMGFEASVSNEQVKLARSEGPQPAKRRFTPAESLALMKCISDVRGIRYPLRVLAKSKSAQ